METQKQIAETQELDQRRSNCLTVTLWWVKGTMETFVTVLDTKQNPPVEHHIEVPEGENPYHVFHHPMGLIDG
jgi:hypothetical protein